MNNLIQEFLQKELPQVLLKHHEDPFLPGIFIEKTDDNFTLGINSINLNKLNLTPEEMSFFLYHEKGHLELKHFDGSSPVDRILEIMLLGLFSLLSVVAIIGSLFFSISWLIGISFLIISTLIMSNMTIKMGKSRNKELAADNFALKFCTIETVVSLMKKIDNLYPPPKILKFLSSHPTGQQRIENAIKKRP